MGLMESGGGLTTSKLALATATEGEVLNGKTFYAAGKAFRAGTMTCRLTGQKPRADAEIYCMVQKGEG